MAVYHFPYNWKLSIPDGWHGEYDESSGQCVFYPDDSDLTLRVTPFHAGKDGVPAPAEVMEKAYLHTIPASAAERDAKLCCADGFSARMYEDTLQQDHRTVHVFYIGCYTVGELLSVSIWGTSKRECKDALKILQTITR